MKVKDRVKAPTPKFFRVLRTVGVVLGTIAGVLATAPVSLPAGLVTVAGYLAVAGGVVSAVSQATVMIEPEGEKALIQDANASLDAAIGVGIKKKDKSTAQLISASIEKTRKFNPLL